MFKIGDKVKIFSKSVGREYLSSIHTQGIISDTFITKRKKVYIIKHDHFLECDLIDNSIKNFFTDKDFEI